MAKPVFDKSLFKAAQQKASEKKFSDVDSGVYNCEIVKACLEHSKKGRLQAKFEFQISEDDDKHANSHLWNYVGLSDNDGVPQEKGYEALGVILNILKVDPAIDDPDAAIESIIGSKIRLDYTAAKEEGEYEKFRIKKLLAGPDGSVPNAYGSTQTDELDEIEAGQSETTQVDITEGDILKLTSGEEIVLVSMQDSSESSDGKQYVLGYPKGTSMAKAKLYSAELVCGVEKALPSGSTAEGPSSAPTPSRPTATDLDALDGGLEEEELTEEEELPTWKVGDAVKGVSAKTGNPASGTIHVIEGDTIKIATPDKKLVTLRSDSIQRQ